jgi:outer membrane protein assembly factor BamA
MQNSGRFRLFFLLGLLCVFCNTVSYSQLPDSVVTTANNLGTITDTLPQTVVIGNISITGFKRTKPYIIQREVPFKKEESIQRSELPKKIELCRQQIMNTSLFVDVTVTVEYPLPDIVFVNIVVKERWYLFPLPVFELIDRNFNTWWVEHRRSLERINYGLYFVHKNLSGRNDKLNIGLISGYTQRASLRYENPFLDKSLKHGMNLGFSYSRNREVNYRTDSSKQRFFKNEKQFLIRQIRVDLAYTYRPAIKTRNIFRVSYNDIQINDTVRKLNPEFFPASLTRIRFPDFTYVIQYFNVDYIPYPLKGFSGEAQFYKRFGRGNNMWQIAGRGTYSKQVLPKSYVQFQASGLVRFPYKQPYYNLRMFGSSDLYMRGLEYYIIDGVAGGMVRATAKHKALDFGIPNPLSKSHTKIPVRVFVKTYGDMGYAYNPKPGTSLFNNKLLKTWGIGIDVVTIYDIVFKLEYSFNQIGEKGLFVHTKDDF